VNSSVEDTNPSVDSLIVCMDSVLVQTAFDISLMNAEDSTTKPQWTVFVGSL